MSLSKSFFLSRRNTQIDASLALENLITFEMCLDSVYSFIQNKMIENEKAVQNMSLQEQRAFTKELIGQFVSKDQPLVHGFVTDKGVAEFSRLTKALSDEMLNWGVLTDAMEDPDISEIQGNDYKSIYVERGGEQQLLRNSLTNEIITFNSAEDMLKIANKLLRFSEVSLSRNKALQGGMTMEGYRVAAVDPSVAAPDKAEGGLEDKSPMFVIRKYGSRPPDLDFLRKKYHSITVEQSDFLNILARTGIPIVICGATGSGKTVLLQSILNNRIPTRRLAVVEDQSELNAHQRDANGVDHSNTIQFEARPAPPGCEPDLTYPTFLNVTMQLLRMTPRLICLGEMRTDEIVSQAITAAYTGHGLYSTIHADNVEDCIMRITSAVQAISSSIPFDINMRKVCASIPFILSQQRLEDGTRKLLEFAEIEGVEYRDGTIVPKVNMLFKFIPDLSQRTSEDDRKTYGDFYQVGRISDKMLEKLKLKSLTQRELDILSSGPAKGEAPIKCTFLREGEEDDGV